MNRFAAGVVAVLGSASLLGAQGAVQLDPNDVHSVIVTSDTRTGAGVGINNPLYLPSNTEYTGTANLWMRGNNGPDAAVQSGCTGNLLWTGRHILTAAHCVSTGTNNITSQFGTARFRTAAGGWQDYNWNSVTVKSGYSGAVIEEQDVAILELDIPGEVDASFERYNIASSNPFNQKTRFLGYGRTGTGLTGDNDNFTSPQFTNNARLRRGWNTFESSCNDAGSCATAFAANPGAFGGVLFSDFDESGVSSPGFMCNNLFFCNPGYGGFEEVGVGRGDSGGAAFIESSNLMVGVASFGGGPAPAFGFSNYNGFACVANYADNAVCMDNYQFIVRTVGVPTVVPEPTTYALVAFGLATIGFARRRRSASK